MADRGGAQHPPAGSRRQGPAQDGQRAGRVGPPRWGGGEVGAPGLPGGPAGPRAAAQRLRRES
eukprot:11157166-Alexandrium_andersonii.AAC.1